MKHNFSRKPIKKLIAGFYFLDDLRKFVVVYLLLWTRTHCCHFHFIIKHLRDHIISIRAVALDHDEYTLEKTGAEKSKWIIQKHDNIWHKTQNEEKQNNKKNKNHNAEN